MSTEDIKKHKLNYLYCNQGDLHEGEQLNYVYIESKIPQTVLMCPVCKTQAGDKKQRIMPLKIFLSEASQHMQSKPHQFGAESLLGQVDALHQKMLNSLKDSVQKMAMYDWVIERFRSIKELEEAINQGHKHIKQKLLDQSQTQQNLPQLFEQILNSNYDAVHKLKQDVFRITENVHYTNGKIEIEFKPQKVLDYYSKLVTSSDDQKFSEFNTAMSTLNTQFKTQIGKVSKTIEKISQLKIAVAASGEYQFSQTLKSPTIILEGKTANQKTNQNQEQRFALIEPGFDLVTKSRFAVKILQLSNWVGLGICFSKIMQTKQFKFDYNNLGHGSYLISSNGYSWSHSKKEDNIASKAFSFAAGDIIICEFDPEKKIVQFKKKGENDKKFQLAIEVPEGDEVYGCVNLCNQNDKVELAMNEVDEEEF